MSAVYQIMGRSTMLSKFRDEMSSGQRSYGMTQAWIGNQAQELQRLDTLSKNAGLEFTERSNRGDCEWTEWFGDIEKLNQQRGFVAGAAEELLKINREVQGYFIDKTLLNGGRKSKHRKR